MQLIMPKLGLTMTEGTITEWLKAPGDPVQNGEVLFTYETEKVTLEYEAPADGVVARILTPAGITVPVGTVVCELWVQGEAAESRLAELAAERPAAQGEPERLAAEPVVAATNVGHPDRVEATPKARALAAALGVDLTGRAGRGPGGRVQAADVEQAHQAAPRPPQVTPVARRVATAEGVSLSGVQGSGPGGRITRVDVERAAESLKAVPAAEPLPDVSEDRPAGGAAPGETIVPMRGIRQVIAQRMSESASTAPHVTLFTEADATNLVASRAQLNQDLPTGEKLSYNALLAAIVARALHEYPLLNARLEADGIHALPEINIALAVDTERGLMTPVLPNVDRLGLRAVQRGYAGLIERALAGTSLPMDFAGGTFTITNLGGLEIDGFTPIINPPQAAILGVGRITEKPVVREGAVVVRAMLVLSLSFDHRINDGAPAARFLQRIKQMVEKPLSLLL